MCVHACVHWGEGHIVGVHSRIASIPHISINKPVNTTLDIHCI